MTIRGIITIAASALVLTACGGSSSTETAACEPANPTLTGWVNDTLDAYGEGESIFGGSSANVDLPGAGTMGWDALLVAPLTNAGEPGLWAFNTSAQFVVPLNSAAISAMPDAAVGDGAAVKNAVDSAEAQALLACLN
jgi:hypothetical protein